MASPRPRTCFCGTHLWICKPWGVLTDSSQSLAFPEPSHGAPCGERPLPAAFTALLTSILLEAFELLCWVARPSPGASDRVHLLPRTPCLFSLLHHQVLPGMASSCIWTEHHELDLGLLGSGFWPVGGRTQSQGEKGLADPAPRDSLASPLNDAWEALGLGSAWSTGGAGARGTRKQRGCQSAWPCSSETLCVTAEVPLFPKAQSYPPIPNPRSLQLHGSTLVYTG